MEKWKIKQARCEYEILCLAKNKSNLSLTFLDCILLLVLMLQKQWIFFLTYMLTKYMVTKSSNVVL